MPEAHRAVHTGGKQKVGAREGHVKNVCYVTAEGAYGIWSDDVALGGENVEQVDWAMLCSDG